MVPQETQRRKPGPDSRNGGRIVSVARQQRQRLFATACDTRRGVGRWFGIAPQGVACRGVEVGQQSILPRVPQARTGSDDVRNGQQIQLTQPLAPTYGFGEAMHDIGVGDVLPLRRRTHQQMPAYEPSYAFDVIVRQTEFLAEDARIFFAQHGVITAAPFGDVVE